MMLVRQLDRGRLLTQPGSERPMAVEFGIPTGVHAARVDLAAHSNHLDGDY